MGGLMRLLLPVMLLLGGCAAASAVTAVPTVFSEAMAYFNGQDVSMALNMQHSLAAVQRGLERMNLHVDVLEAVDEGYAIEFGNGELNGDIRLQRQTQRLTTINIKVYRGLAHQPSVEKTIIDEVVLSASVNKGDDAHFDFSGYDKVYAKPETSTKVLGWFRSGGKLHVRIYDKPGWLKITLPSGTEAFIKGTLQTGNT